MFSMAVIAYMLCTDLHYPVVYFKKDLRTFVSAKNDHKYEISDFTETYECSQMLKTIVTVNSGTCKCS